MSDGLNRLRPREECGVFGIFGHPDAATLTYYGLHALQHRGQESAGIVVGDGLCLKIHKGMGLVSEVFDEGVLAGLPGDRAIGHVRYSTTGATLPVNAQPILLRCRGSSVALCHNGNLVNAASLRGSLEKSGSIFQTTLDTEVI
ncbi:MAG: amidophosphoribosyltransferase, partial [Bacillota bacterium]